MGSSSVVLESGRDLYYGCFFDCENYRKQEVACARCIGTVETPDHRIEMAEVKINKDNKISRGPKQMTYYSDKGPLAFRKIGRLFNTR